MKRYIFIISVVAFNVLSSCGKHIDPPTTTINGGNTGGNTGGTTGGNTGGTTGGTTGGGTSIVPVIKVCNGVSVLYKNGVPSKFEFTSGWGSEIQLTGSGDDNIELMNEELGTAAVTTAKNGSSLKLSNVYVSNDNTLTDTKAILAKNIFIKVTTPTSETDLVIVDDGTYSAGTLDFAGSAKVLTTAQADTALRATKLGTIAFILGQH